MITFIIHAFKRPQRLQELRESMTRYYPDVPVLEYDDSKYDRGLSWGRNWLVSMVRTPYYVLFDDDFVVTKETRIELMLDKIQQGYDIVGGALKEDGNIRHFEGRYKLEDGHLEYIRTTEEPLDFVFNFFMAKKEVKGWDNRLKLAEHTAFFLDNIGRWKIGYEPNCVITHKPYKFGDYLEYRNRAWKYFDDYMKRKGIHTVTNFDGIVYKLGDYKEYQKKYEDSISKS